MELISRVSYVIHMPHVTYEGKGCLKSHSPWVTDVYLSGPSVLCALVFSGHSCGNNSHHKSSLK